MALIKRNYNKKYERKNSAAKPGMTSEKLIRAFERYSVMLIVFMLFGLLNSNQWGMRGFPFPWLVRGRMVDAHSFFRSLFFMLIIVVVTDCAARIVRASREPAVKTAYNTNPYTGSYQAKNVTTTSDYSSVSVNDTYTVSEAEDSDRSYTSEAHSGEADASMAQAGEIDLDSLLKKGGSKLLNAGRNKKSGKLKPSASERSDDDKKPGSTITVIITIIAMIMCLGISLTDIFDSGSDWDDSDDDIHIEADVYENLSPYCEDVFDSLSSGEPGRLESIGDGDSDKIINYTDWSTLSFSQFYSAYAYSDADETDEAAATSVILKYRVYSYDNDGDPEYLIASFLFEGEDPENDPDSASLTGASFCRVDVSDDEEFDNIEPYELDSAGYIDLNNAVSVGKDRIDGSSILTYY